jgi:hypothetical protein
MSGLLAGTCSVSDDAADANPLSSTKGVSVLKGDLVIVTCTDSVDPTDFTAFMNIRVEHQNRVRAANQAQRIVRIDVATFILSCLLFRVSVVNVSCALIGHCSRK